MKKIFWVFMAIFFCAAMAHSQTKSDLFLNKKVDMPEYSGGMSALMRFLSQNIVYPQDAERKKIEGTVLLRFTVLPSGQIDNIDTLKSLFPSCDAEAIRVVKLMPKWKPASLDGKPTKVVCHLPIVFRISGNIGSGENK